MQKKQKYFQITVVILLLFLTLFGAQTVFSQAPINTITITDVNYNQFPLINVTTRILDNTGEAISPLSVNDLVVREIVTEDGVEHKNSVDFSFKKITSGVKLAIVLDSGAGLNHAGLTDKSVAEEIREITQQFIDTLGQKDSLELIFVEWGTTSVIAELTGNKSALQEALNYITIGRVEEYTNGLDGVKKALEDLHSSTSAQTPRGVIFITPGIQSKAMGNKTEFAEVENLSAKYNIPVHTILVGEIGRWQEAEEELTLFAQKTNAQFKRYTSPSALDSLHDHLDRQRFQYLLSYKTNSPSSAERYIDIEATSASTIRDTFSFTITPPPQAPEIELVINNGDPVTRKAPQADSDLSNIPFKEVKVTGNINWPDGYPRDITKAQLMINGQEHGSPIKNLEKDEQLSFIWDLRTITEPGPNTTKVAIQLTDSLGLTSSKVLEVPVEVIIPAPPPTPTPDPTPSPCDSLQDLPYVGPPLNKACFQYGITPAQMLNMLIAIAALVLVIIIWFNRETVKEAGVRVTGAIVRVTQQIMGGREPKAYLEPMKGFPEEEMATRFEIYGETPIGRDREFSDLIFSYPKVSRLHCTLHEADLGVSWSIEDEDSSNGT